MLNSAASVTVNVTPSGLPTVTTSARAVLTPRGHAAVAVICLGYELDDLAGEDRAYICQMLRDLLESAGT
jgi:hypothetical protein